MPVPLNAKPPTGRLLQKKISRYFRPHESAHWSGGELTIREDHLSAQKCPADPGSEVSADVGGLLVAVMERFWSNDFRFIEIDEGEVGVVSDSDRAFRRY